MGLHGFIDALTKITAQPEKDFGELVRQRRRKRGLPVTPAGKVLPFLPVAGHGGPDGRAAVDAAAEQLLRNEAQGGELHEARVRLAERRVREAMLAIDQAAVMNIPAWKRGHLELTYVQELNAYERLLGH
jgi:hypothetical protein